MEKNNNMLVVMNVILMLLIVGLGVYLVIDKNSDKKPSQEPGENVQEPDNNPNDDVQTPSTPKDKLAESFTIAVNGKKHTVNVKYKVVVSEDKNSLAHYVATIYYDNQKLVDYDYLFDKVVMTEQEAQKYTISDFKNRISVADFHIIKGTNNQEYIGIYDNRITEIGPERILHILDDKGNEIFKLTDDTSTSIENHYYDDYKLTKISPDYILFFAFREKDQLPGYPLDASGNLIKAIIVEYKLTLGDTLKFEKINTYKDGSIAGGGGYLNDIVPNGY